MEDLNLKITSGGFHLFSIPYFSDYCREDLDPTMTKERRLEIFGHDDHIRSFGYKDTEESIQRVFRNWREIPLKDRIRPGMLAAHGIPKFALQCQNGHQVRLFIK